MTLARGECLRSARAMLLRACCPIRVVEEREGEEYKEFLFPLWEVELLAGGNYLYMFGINLFRAGSREVYEPFAAVGYLINCRRSNVLMGVLRK